MNNFKQRRDGMVRGFVEPRIIKGTRCQIKLERIDPLYKRKDEIDDVLVIFCARQKNDFCRVVGWYKHATVYRHMKGREPNEYNIVANYQDITLLPVTDRDIIVPSKRRKSAQYGFGQAPYWFADEDEAKDFVQNILIRIENYPIQNYRECEMLTEGNRTRVYVNLYERNNYARNECIRNYGAVCQICGFDATRTYGKDYEGAIEVHHKTPISQTGKNYQINPKEDLLPVCPNCHMILHKKVNGTTISIEELKAIVNKDKNL